MTGTLLIVEDDADVLAVLTEYLGTLGHRVVPAASGQEALERLRTSAVRFDLAVVDWTLRDLTGRDVLQALRERQPDCRIIVTTGHSADIVSDARLGVGPGGVLRKPFTMRTLALRVEMLLEQARTEF
jgi:DNA-binding response OmpR family regulator